jgi:decaprenylphospho-beta-D-ribofuranose 2-oxidase
VSETPVSGWGRFPVERCHVFRPERRADVAATVAAKTVPSYIARGLGRSYGDAAVNAGGGVVVHERLNRMRAFDPATGVLDCEAGTSVADIIETWLPRGWFPAVTPGTKFVTVGGAIAADVHGKNHHRDGTFSCFVESFTLLTADGEMLSCSRRDHADVFWASVGGLGLTGMILDARVRLRAVESSWLRVDYRRSRHLDDTLAAFTAGDAGSPYSVAWIDCLAGGKALGRAVLMHGEHATAADVQAAGRRGFAASRAAGLSVPIDVPGALLNHVSMRVFNGAYYAAHGDAAGRLVHYDRFFYPLDGVAHWNRLYGRNGFTQYQVALPPEEGERGLVELLTRLSRSGRPSFLAVLKRLGAQGPGLLSFPREGYTLALDLPVRPGLVEFLAELDRLVLARGGRIYLAKDATATRDTVRAMYPRLDEFRAIKQRLDPRGVLSSSLARRVGLVS